MRNNHTALARPNRASTAAGLTLALLLGAPLAGCGDDEPVAATRGSGGTSAPAPAAPAPGAPAGGAPAAGATPDSTLVPAKLRNINWEAEDYIARANRELRDPFQPHVDDLIEAMSTVRVADTSGESRRPSGAKISQFDVHELQLMAIITGTAVHRAMVTDPTGLGHIVRAGDVLGRDTLYRVTRITRNEVVFRPLEPPTDENQPKEIRKALLTQQELEELLP